MLFYEFLKARSHLGELARLTGPAPYEQLLRAAWSKKQIKIKNTMETFFQKPVTFMCFWLNYWDENHHIERITVAVKNIDHLFSIAGEIIKADRLYLFLLSNGTRIDDNENLSSLENGTELIVCKEE